MTKGLLFWILMILWAFAVLGVVFDFYPVKYGYVSNIFLFVLFFLLGSKVFGPPLKD